MKSKLGITKRVEMLGETIILMAVGLIIFKFIPELIWGDKILYDASLHLVFLSMILYIIYLTIEHTHLKHFYFIFSAIIITAMGIQRIFQGAHNLAGLILGLVIAGISILIPRMKYHKNQEKMKKKKNKKRK